MDLPAGCEAISRFANLATLSAKLARHKVGQLRGPASLHTLLDALGSDFKDIARTARAIDLDQPGFAAFYRRQPAWLHAWLHASRVQRSPQRNKDTGTPTVGTTSPHIDGQ